MSFWRQSLAAARLAWIQQFEYRLNLFVDVALQPVLVAVVEVGLWYAVVSSIGSGDALGGFSRAHYLHYALWAAFVGRISSNWMYEMRMVDEVQSGGVNVILTRPVSFYQFYLSQFMSYKVLTSSLALLIPASIAGFLITGPTELSHLPLAYVLILFYLVLAYNLSFCVVCLGFFLNRVSSFTVAKNIALTCLTGELFPIDLAPESLKNILFSLPFASGVYIPVGYITGRLVIDDVVRGLVVVMIWSIMFGCLGWLLWRAGLRRYTGTGA